MRLAAVTLLFGCGRRMITEALARECDFSYKAARGSDGRGSYRQARAPPSGAALLQAPARDE
jgi:hypothetical protein